MQSVLDKGLREEEAAGHFIGISEDDFADLVAYANLKGIEIIEDKDIKGKLAELNK
jgi:hypothetical protein